jgi:hypothetical protein
MARSSGHAGEIMLHALAQAASTFSGLGDKVPFNPDICIGVGVA